MTKRDYEAAARIVQDIARQSEPDATAAEDAFVEFFRADSSAFDGDRFRRACKLGANVRGRKRA